MADRRIEDRRTAPERRVRVIPNFDEVADVLDARCTAYTIIPGVHVRRRGLTRRSSDVVEKPATEASS